MSRHQFDNTMYRAPRTAVVGSCWSAKPQNPSRTLGEKLARTGRIVGRAAGSLDSEDGT